MRRSFNKQAFRKIAALALGFAAIGIGAPKSSATNQESTVQSQGKKDAIREEHKPIRSVSTRRNPIGFSEANPYKHNRTPKKNQRQKRKLWRQVPQSKHK